MPFTGRTPSFSNTVALKLLANGSKHMLDLVLWGGRGLLLLSSLLLPSLELSDTKVYEP